MRDSGAGRLGCARPLLRLSRSSGNLWHLGDVVLLALAGPALAGLRGGESQLVCRIDNTERLRVSINPGITQGHFKPIGLRLIAALVGATHL